MTIFERGPRIQGTMLRVPTVGLDPEEGNWPSLPETPQGQRVEITPEIEQELTSY